MRPLAMLALPLALLATGVAACGDSGVSSGEREEAEIEALGEDFEAVLRREDTRAFCRMLAPNDVHRLGGGRSDGRAECLVVWGAARNPLFQAENADLDIEEVNLKGRYATAQLANGGELGFAKEGGRWYVSLRPAPSQRKGASS